MRMLLEEEDGQAIVEYILMLSVMLSIVLIIGVGFRKSLFSVWTKLASEIAAACPNGCAKDPTVVVK